MTRMVRTVMDDKQKINFKTQLGMKEFCRVMGGKAAKADSGVKKKIISSFILGEHHHC